VNHRFASLDQRGKVHHRVEGLAGICGLFEKVFNRAPVG
jgi:hypothetical protein